MTKGTGKSLTVKDWFGNKIAQEVKRNISMCDVFCIIKETEKAVYAVLNLGCDSRKTVWIPKSVLVERAVGEDADTGRMNHETLIVDSYEEAIEEFKIFWGNFK